MGDKFALQALHPTVTPHAHRAYATGRAGEVDGGSERRAGVGATDAHADGDLAHPLPRQSDLLSDLIQRPPRDGSSVRPLPKQALRLPPLLRPATEFPIPVAHRPRSIPMDDGMGTDTHKREPTVADRRPDRVIGLADEGGVILHTQVFADVRHCAPPVPCFWMGRYYAA